MNDGHTLCPICSRSIKVNAKTGRMARHGHPNRAGWGGGGCPTSGVRPENFPARVQEIIERTDNYLAGEISRMDRRHAGPGNARTLHSLESKGLVVWVEGKVTARLNAQSYIRA